MNKLLIALLTLPFTLQAAGPHLCPIRPLEDNGWKTKYMTKNLVRPYVCLRQNIPRELHRQRLII